MSLLSAVNLILGIAIAIALVIFIPHYLESDKQLKMQLAKMQTKKIKLIEKMSMDEYLIFLSSRLKFSVQLVYLNNNIANITEMYDVRNHTLILANFLNLIGPKMIVEHEEVFGEGALSIYIMSVLQIWSTTNIMDGCIKELKIE